MKDLHIINHIENIEPSEKIAIIKRYKYGYIVVLTIDDLKKVNTDISFCRFIELLQPCHTHIVIDSITSKFWFASV